MLKRTSSAAVAIDEREHLAEQRHPGVRDDALMREPGELPSAAVERRDLCERETADGIADVWVIRVAGRDRGGVSTLDGRDAAVMRHDRAIVGAEAHVHLECRCADLQRVGEGFERALRDQPEPTAVGLHVELSRKVVGLSFDDGTRRRCPRTSAIAGVVLRRHQRDTARERRDGDPSGGGATTAHAHTMTALAPSFAPLPSTGGMIAGARPPAFTPPAWNLPPAGRPRWLARGPRVGYTEQVGVLIPGTLLGECRIEAVVGTGGMGVVYRARQLDLDRDVAVKVIAPSFVDDPESRKRFPTEARAAAAVEHPNVVPVHHVGVADGQAYLVMRYVPGDDLQTVVRRAEALEPLRRRAVSRRNSGRRWTRSTAPDTSTVTSSRRTCCSTRTNMPTSATSGSRRRHSARQDPTKSDHWVGTLDYAAPEQIRGERVDARTDVYSLGGVLYFTLTGHAPFERPSGQGKLWAQLSADVPLPSARRPELPPACDVVVQRALAKDPAREVPVRRRPGTRGVRRGGRRQREAKRADGSRGAPPRRRRETASTTAVPGPTVSSRRHSARTVRRRTA